jgi:hypothetical protein
MKDPVVEEVRRTRERHAAKFKFDLTKIMADAQRRQHTMGHKVVSFPARVPVAHHSH